MSIAIVAGVVVCALAGIAYLERRSLKADVAAVKAQAESELLKLNASIRAKISADVSTVISDLKGNIEKLIADAKEEEKSAIARVKAAVISAEESLRKVI